MRAGSGRVFFNCPAARTWVPALRGLLLLLVSQHTRACPEMASCIVHQQAPASGEREATIVVPPPACDSAIVPCFHGYLVFLCRNSLLQISSLPSPQSIFPQPTTVLAPGLFSNPHAPALSPLAHLWTHVPVWSMYSCSTDCLCISHSVSSAIDRPLHPLPTASNASLLSPERVFPLQRGVFPKFGNLSSASAPPCQGAGSVLLPLLLLIPSFFFFFFFCPTQLCRDVYSPFWCPRSSASFQPVSCENCCIYRYFWCICGERWIPCPPTPPPS